MSTPILATKLYLPPPRPKVVLRPRLLDRLNEGLHGKLTLISAAAGFGKTTLVSAWVAGGDCLEPKARVAWLSLDEGDNDPARFLTYLIAALQTIEANIGKGMLGSLQSPQPPPIESILTALLNEIAAVPDHLILVLDDYHALDAKSIDDAITFLLEHLPPQLHLVISTREDPHLPLARLRARGQLTELRAADLRFTPAEAAEFLSQVMGLSLSEEDIAALEARTEGWIAGLQLAALSMRGRQDATGFIKAFTGSHRFVLDYLLEEVLRQQSDTIQAFLLRTSVLDRLCGPLCDAVLLDSSVSGQETLEYLEHANLFIVPLDNERRWYRYHHLFGGFLRQRLCQSAESSAGDEGRDVADYHLRASQWYEDNGLELEAFHHAAAADDVERASRLIQGKGMPLHVRGALVPVLNWLESLPTATLDARPVLWVMHAGALTTAGQTTGVEQKLQAAEAALQGAELDVETRDLLGRIANNRATLAFLRYQADTAIVQALFALENLRPDNLPVRSISTWALGAAYQQKGDRAAASRALTEAVTISQTIGHTFVTKLATMGLGRVQETENRLYLAAETYRHALQLFGEYPLPSACEAHLGLARICYEWNDLEAAERHGQQSRRLAQQWDRPIDRFIACEVFLAYLKLARGDAAGAAAMLAVAEDSVRQHDFVYRMPEVVAAQVIVALHQGDVAAAARVLQTRDLPVSQARVLLAQGDPAAALSALEPLRRQAESKNWQAERLKVMVLQTVALHAHGEKDKAVQLLGETMALAEPGGFIRTFVDEGAPMAQLLLEAAAEGVMPDYAGKLLAVFRAEEQPGMAAGPGKREDKPDLPVVAVVRSTIEPLSQRELQVLRLLRSELSGPEMAQQLIVSLNTLRTHTKSVFNKLGVNNRRAAVRRAEELGLF